LTESNAQAVRLAAQIVARAGSLRGDV
jgi:hypothetical protein